MPYHVARSSSCPPSRPWAVIKDAGGKVMGCHPTSDAASAQMRALYARGDTKESAMAEIETTATAATAAAAETPVATPTAVTTEQGFQSILIIEGERTSDGRLFPADSLTWRTLPLPLMWQRENLPRHQASVLVGRIDEIWRDGAELKGRGIFDLGSEDGREAARQVAEQFARGVSIDAEIFEDSLVEDGEDLLQVISSARIVGLTIVPFPAFPSAVIALTDHSIPESSPDGRAAATPPAAPVTIQSFAISSRPLAADRSRYSDPEWLAACAGMEGTTDIPKLDGYFPHHEPDGSLSRPGVHACLTRLPFTRRRGLDHARQHLINHLRHNLHESVPASLDAPSLLASARKPIPRSFFASPNLLSPTPITITLDGRLYGHAALWNTCFAGETEYLTEGGVRTLKETVDTVQRVLVSTGDLSSRSRAAREFGGEWQDAEIRSFGEQQLMKVTLRRYGQTKEVYATAQHRWLITPRNSERFRHSPRKVVLTADLEPNMRLSPLFPKKKVTVGKGIRLSQFGVAHGFTFGDGTRRRDGCQVVLFGEKDAALLPYFAMSTSRKGSNPNGVNKVLVSNLPAFFKDLPSLGESLSYLYGWLAGYFAADGTVSPDGTPIMFSATKAHLEHVRDVCLRLGIGTSEIKTFMRNGAGDYEGIPGRVNNNRISPLHRMTLISSTLSAEFFLIPEHQRRFRARLDVNDPHTAWRVVSVEETDRVEEVYCAVVPGNENFTLMDNINVMNCHISRSDVCITPPHSLAAYAYFLTGETEVSDIDVIAASAGVASADGASAGSTFTLDPSGNLTASGSPALCSPSCVPTGPVVLATNHAALAASPEAAKSHYDNTGLAVADIAVGEDAFGIWVAGTLRPGISEAQRVALRGSSLSGDWRRIGGNLELVALLAVNVPGFPIPRLATSRFGLVQTSLVAAGIPRPDPESDEVPADISADELLDQLKREVSGEPDPEPVPDADAPDAESTDTEDPTGQESSAT